jgi:Ran GTPase-activating protein (RanGAP) involved in mRNA processing and transport
MGLGDLSMKIVAEIISQNKHSQIDLSKNIFSDTGLKTLVDAIANSHTIMSIILNANQITCDGAVYLFQTLQKNQTLTHLELANHDCLASKIKLGNKGAQYFSDYLKSSNCLLSIIDLTGAQLTSEAMMTVFNGII